MLLIKEKLETIIKNKIKDDELVKELVDDLMVYNQAMFSDRVYKDVFDSAPVGYVILDYDFRAVKLNDLAKKILNDDAPFYFRQFIHSDSLDLFDHYIKRVIESTFNIPIHLDLVIKNEVKHVKLISNFVSDKYIQCAVVDESFELAKLKEMEFIGFRDYLTGLYNRRFFQEEMKRLDTVRNHPIGLIMADLNGLKLVNDAFGHNHGDDLIRTAAAIIERTCRSDDIVARIGGDEFAIILPNTDHKEVEKMVCRLRDNIKKVKVGEINLSVSFGSATKYNESDSFEKLFKYAEDEMYKEKLLTTTSQRVDIIQGILATLHEKHPNEKEHSERVCDLMMKLGKALGFDSSRINFVKSVGLLHDIGKITVDYNILEQKRQLSDEEMENVKKHSEIGYRILKSTTAFSDVAEIILSHHEKIDSTGYPRGVRNSEIPFEARMLAICDSYDAMTKDRPFRSALTKEKAIKELIDHSGTQFDQLLVEIFIDKVLKNEK